MSSVFFGGVPTEIEVNILRTKYPTPTVGDSWSYEEISQAIEVPVGTNRFKTVTTAWRRSVERENGIVIATDRQGNFKVLDDSGKAGMSKDKLLSAGRMARRSRKVAGLVDPTQLSDEQRKEFDHVTKVSATILQATRLKSKAALPELE